MFRMSLASILEATLVSPALAGPKARRDIFDAAVAAKSLRILAAELQVPVAAVQTP